MHVHRVWRLIASKLQDEYSGYLYPTEHLLCSLCIASLLLKLYAWILHDWWLSKMIIYVIYLD